MPCYEPNASDYARVNAERHINKLTDMLCSTLKQLEAEASHVKLRKDVADWWDKHKKFDEDRKK